MAHQADDELPNRYLLNPVNVGEGATENEIILQATKGEHDYTRNLVLKIQEQYWTTSQVLHFTLWFSSLCMLILSSVNWGKAKFEYEYFLLGMGSAIVQAFFPHGVKTCDSTAKFRPYQGCRNHLDCTTLPEHMIQKDECNVQYGGFYLMLRFLTVILLVVGVVLIVIDGKKESKTTKSASFSWVVGFATSYTITYMAS